MVNDDPYLIDGNGTVSLADVGAPGYVAATAVRPDGATHFVLARLDAFDDTQYDGTCRDVSHEQCGQLPLEFVKRLTASRRRRWPDSGPQ